MGRKLQCQCYLVVCQDAFYVPCYKNVELLVYTYFQYSNLLAAPFSVKWEC
jgi:hypothetical protein